MVPRYPFDPVFQSSLPLPLARLYGRVFHAKGERERHDYAFYLIEAALKLGASALVARYRSCGHRSARVDAALKHLALPSLGQWRSIFRETLAFLGEGTCSDSWVRGIIEHLRASRRNNDLAEAFAALAHASQYAGRVSAHPGALEILDLLPTYRNAVMGAHGGVKRELSLYRNGQCALLALAHTLLAGGAIVGGARFAYADEVRLGMGGEERVVWMDLHGTWAICRVPTGSEPVPRTVLPGRLYLQISPDEILELHPFLLYQTNDVQDQVFFLNRARPGTRGVQFLCYETGELHVPGRDTQGASLAADLQAFLGWVMAAPVDSDRIPGTEGVMSRDSPVHGEGAEEEPEPSGSVIGDFEILGEIGRGGMAIVYLARQRSLGRLVALKVLPPTLTHDPTARARFLREITALSRCDHVNVVKILCSGAAGDTQYYAMELIDGCDLAKIVDVLQGRRRASAQVPLKESDFDRAAFSATGAGPKFGGDVGSPAAERLERAEVRSFKGDRDISFRIAAVMRDAARGAHHIHDQGIVHRDLKPTNIMVTREDHRPVIMDLGLAKLCDASQSLTIDRGSILGTLRYMSPEQLQRNAIDVDARADVYALGAVLYELACLRPMLDGETEERLTMQIMFEEPRPPQKANPSLPTDLATIITKATYKDPRARYQSAAELAEDLDRCIHGEAIAAKPPTLGYVLRLFVRRRRSAVVSAAAVMVMFVAVLAAWVARLHRDSEQLAQVMQLSDTKLLGEYTGAADALWPCVPGKAADMETWIEKARELRGHLSRHRATLKSLRDPSSVADAGARATLLWQRGLIEDLIAKLEAFCTPETGLIADVEARLRFARTVEARTIDGAKEAWDRAIASIRNPEECPAYAGLHIEPQLGLTPIGRDSHSGLWEFAHLQTGEVPNRTMDGRLQITAATGLVLVLIPGGTFWMGAQPEGSRNVDPDAGADEGPVHAVTVSPFFLSKYEMTLAQWRRFTREDPPGWPADGKIARCAIMPCDPMVFVSWDECQTVARRLGLALPTEAQWEYAARAGTTTAWWTGNDIDERLAAAANFADKTTMQGLGAPPEKMWVYEKLTDGHGVLAPVGSLAPNAFGLHDTAGNVWEWCSDWYAPYTLDGAQEPSGAGHVYRGGSWCFSAWCCRSAARVRFAPAPKYWDVGVRLARALVAGTRGRAGAAAASSR